MLKKTIISLALLIMCETSFADCTLQVLKGDTQNAFDGFKIKIKDDQFTPKASNDHYLVTYKITDVSEHLGSVDDFVVVRGLEGNYTKAQNKHKLGAYRKNLFGFKKTMTVRIARASTLKPITEKELKKLPAGEHFVNFTLTALCR